MPTGQGVLINTPIRRTMPKRKRSSAGTIPRVRRKLDYKPKASSTKVVRRRKKASGSKDDAGAEQTNYSQTVGKDMKPTLSNLYKQVNANRVVNQYEFNSVNRMYTGGFHLLNTSSGSTGLTLPIHLHELTAVPNFNGTSVSTPNTSFQIAMSSAAATATANAQTLGINNKLFVQSSVGAATTIDCYPCGKAMFKTSQIKLNLYGASQLPVKIHTYVCSFKNENLCPDELNTLSNSINPSTGVIDSVVASAFWQAMAKPLVVNPILVQSSNHAKDMKIIKHDVFQMSPKQNTDSDSVNHVKTVSYYFKWNKECNLRWGDTGQVAIDISTTGTQIDSGDNLTTVKASERIYLIVAAEDYSTSVSDAYTSNSNASYDIVVKNTWQRLR